MLYGNSRNLHLVVFRPHSVKYECYTTDYSFENIDYFKIRLDDGMCLFYVKENEKWREIHSAELDFILNEVGFFLKSWERCKCDVDVEVEYK